MSDSISPIPPPWGSASEGRRLRVTLRLRKLVGPGAADFFRDACALMDDPHRFSSTSHLVGHLMRETESALRVVLQPLTRIAGTVGEPTKNDKQKFEITSILTLLDIPFDNEVAKKPLDIYVIPSGIDAFWFSFHNE